MFRVATFNVENLDLSSDDRNPKLEVRIPFLRRMLERLHADVLCLQEVHSQDKSLSALNRVLKDTPYELFHREHTTTQAGNPLSKRNLVVLSRLQILSSRQYLNHLVQAPSYDVLSSAGGREPKRITWERPILHVVIDHPHLGHVHVVNLHMKARTATNIRGQKSDRFTWKSASGRLS